MKKIPELFDFVDVVAEIMNNANDEQEIDDCLSRMIKLILSQAELSKEVMLWNRKRV